MVFFGLNMAESVSTRGSGTSTTAVWTSMRPALAVVGVFPRVTALKIVVFPDCGNPMIPSFILTLVGGVVILCLQAEVAEQADAHDSKSCSFGIVGSIPTFGIIQHLPFADCGQAPACILLVAARECRTAASRFIIPGMTPAKHALLLV